MRAAADCHPLPDQLHPCSWFSWFCSSPTLRLNSQPRRSMRFTTPSIASAGESVFAFEKYSFPKPEFPSHLLVSSPASALRFHFFEWLSKLLVSYASARRDPALSSRDFRLREGSRLFCSSSRERRRERCNPKSGSGDGMLELSSLFRVIGFAADHSKKHVPFHSPQFRSVFFRRSETNLLRNWTLDFRLELPRRAESPPA